MADSAIAFAAWWPYVLVVVGGLVTYFWRALGVALSGRINAGSRLFEWVACVAYAMLAEAQEKRAQGLDVLVGWVDTHGRADTEAMLHGLAVLMEKSLASVGAPEPQQIVIRPYDPGTIKEIERAIVNSGLGFAPQNDGRIIRINVPPLTTWPSIRQPEPSSRSSTRPRRRFARPNKAIPKG